MGEGERSNFAELMLHLREAWECHQRDWTRPGFRAVAVLRIAQWSHRVPNRIVRRPILFLVRAALRWIRNNYGIEIDEWMHVGRRFAIGHQSGIIIHPNTVFGDDCSVRQGVTISSNTPETATQTPVFGDRVDVGPGAVVIGGITIGDDVKIGPNAVVTMNVPAGASVIGNPMRIIPPKPAAAPPSASPAGAG